MPRLSPIEYVRTLAVPDGDSGLRHMTSLRPFDVPPTLGAPAPSLTTTEPGALIVDQSILAFANGLKPISRSDVLNSALLAQLAANVAADRENQTVQWYAKYREVLENIGWVIGGFTFTKFDGGGGAFTMHEVVLKLVAAIATGNDAAIVKGAIESLKALSDGDDRIVLFNRTRKNLSKGNFQVAAASDEGGAVNLKIGAFYFNTSEEVTNVLWFRWSSNQTELYQGSQVITLNDDVYRVVRQEIIQKLGDRAIKYVRELPIED